MNHLSGMDAVFLHAESAETPMHVGSLHVLELPKDYRGDFFENVQAFMARRLHLAPVFTRKLALMPFDLSDPVWVEEDDIDLEHHVRHITLPKPGSNRQLQQVIARQHSMLLDRSRPLWEMIIVDGLKSGEVALYVKMHHAGIDGQAGMAVARAIFDSEPGGRVIKPPRHKLQRNQYQLGVGELASAALRNTAQQYAKLLRMAPEMLRNLQSVLPQPADPASAAGSPADPGGSFPWGRQIADLIPPRTPLNVAITNQRSFAGRTVPLVEVKLIAQRFGVSFNDVVLATASGALRRYLLESDELPTKSMLAATPVSLREAGDAANNNQVSMITMDLASDEADPTERLRRICAGSSQRKSVMNKLRSSIPMDFPMFAAPWLVSGLASLYGRTRMANYLPPAANLVISNVAGSPTPHYFAGAKVLCYYPVSIVIHGMALNVTVQSYAGRLDYGLIACRQALPDLNELGDHFLAEHRALLELAQGQPGAEPAPAARKDAAAPTARKPRAKRPAAAARSPRTPKAR